jgi:hypothetical protein
MEILHTKSTIISILIFLLGFIIVLFSPTKLIEGILYIGKMGIGLITLSILILTLQRIIYVIFYE